MKNKEEKQETDEGFNYLKLMRDIQLITALLIIVLGGGGFIVFMLIR